MKKVSPGQLNRLAKRYQRLYRLAWPAALERAKADAAEMPTRPEPTDASLPDDLMSLKKIDLQALCIERKIDFAAGDTKAELIEKLEAA